MAEQDLRELEQHALRDEADELDEDNRLKPSFVDAVIAALDQADEARAYDLVEPLHPADIADLFELLDPDQRRRLAAAITDLMTGEVIAELNDYVRDDMIEALPPEAVAEIAEQLDTDDAVQLLEDLEPEDQRNRRALGFNMSTEPARREAMERARDQGVSAASGRVELLQADDPLQEAGFVIFMPVYDGGETPATVDERRNRLIGFVYSPFRATDLFEHTFDARTRAGMSVRIYDTAGTDPADLLFTTPPDPTVPAIHITRDFRATPAQLMRAHTDPELFVRWTDDALDRAADLARGRAGRENRRRAASRHERLDASRVIARETDR